MNSFNFTWGLTESVDVVNASRQDKESLQGALCRAYESSKAHRFLQDLPPNHLPWIISSSQEVQWLAHIGDPASGTHMSSTEFIFAVQQRLRVQLFDQEYCSPPGQEGRTFLIDPVGFHCLGCPRGGGPIHRHELVSEVIFHECKQAALNPRRDPAHILPNEQSRPGDVFIPIWL